MGRNGIAIRFLLLLLMGGTVQADVLNRHPRCVFRPSDHGGLGRTVEQVRELYAQDSTFRGIMHKALEVRPENQHPAANAACWIVSGEDRYAQAAIESMLRDDISQTRPNHYSQVWVFALAYDWLYGHPYLTKEKRDRIAAKIRERIRTELDLLDTNWAALWHGRTQAANGVMIAALVLAGEPDSEENLRRALGHWTGALRALEFSEGWPEGASYWIYNRAAPFALAADCYITSTGEDNIDGLAIRPVMRTIGLWQLYQYGPNGVFEPYGDSAGSLRLGETGLWTVTTDHYAKVSRDPGVAAAADYFRNRSPAPYGRRELYWNVAITYDPTARPQDPDYRPESPELWMRDHLPQAALFGRDSYGVAFLRGAWGDADETFASFKAGDLLAHHDHYDVGHFSIQRGGNLAPQTGFYGVYDGKHRLGYQVQTVSSNSLLVLAPGEYSNYLKRNPDWWPWVSGGQRVISPTGFSCVSLEDFLRKRDSGPHLERATITAFESLRNSYDYIAADITASYNSTRFSEPGNAAKVSLVTRQFLYLRPQAAFVILDRVDTTDAKFLPKFLLHSLSKPHSDSERTLVGTGESGILETADRVFRNRDGSAVLTSRVLLPRQVRVLKIGGPDYCFYVEADGDPSDGFDGINLTEGSGGRRGDRQVDEWRLEIEPRQPATQTRFLTVHLPRLASDQRPELPVRLVESDASSHAVVVGGTVVIFADLFQPLRALSLPAGAGKQFLLLDAVPGAVYAVGQRRLRATEQGILQFNSDSQVDNDSHDRLRIEVVEGPETKRGHDET